MLTPAPRQVFFGFFFSRGGGCGVDVRVVAKKNLKRNGERRMCRAHAPRTERSSDGLHSFPPLLPQAVDEWGTVAKGIANGKSYIRFSKVRRVLFFSSTRNKKKMLWLPS